MTTVSHLDLEAGWPGPGPGRGGGGGPPEYEQAEVSSLRTTNTSPPMRLYVPDFLWFSISNWSFPSGSHLLLAWAVLSLIFHSYVLVTRKQIKPFFTRTACLGLVYLIPKFKKI